MYEKVEAMEKKMLKGFVGTITTVVETTSVDFYESDEYATRDGYSVTVKPEAGDDDILEFFGISKNMRGYAQSKLFKFKKAYSKYPTEGMKVKLGLDESGFFHILFK